MTPERRGEEGDGDGEREEGGGRREEVEIFR